MGLRKVYSDHYGVMVGWQANRKVRKIRSIRKIRGEFVFFRDFLFHNLAD